MIYFHASRRYTFTMNSFVGTWDKELAQRLISVPYGDLDLREPIPAGLHIFADFERLRPLEKNYVQAIHDRMQQHPESYQTINSPALWSGRLGLNQSLSAAGRNDYRAFRLADIPPDLKFPVFVRWENEHSGSLGEPVATRSAIKERANQYAQGRQRLNRHKLLVVEHLDVISPDGYYRKYSAQKIGDRLFSRHLFFSKGWVTKNSDLIEPSMNAEELEFIRTFPDHDDVLEAFRLAGLDYGRIDYGFVNGRMQVWEINTNPIVLHRPHMIEPERMEGQQISGQAILAWLRQLDAESPQGPDRRLFGRLSGQRWQAQLAATRGYDKRRK